MKDIKTVKTMVLHLWDILDRKQRVHMLAMMVIIVIGSGFELLGVSAMLPFIQSLLSPEELAGKPYISFIMKAFSISDADKLFVVVGIGIIVIYLLKNIYLSISAYFQLKYSCDTKKKMAVRVLKSYMERPYSFFTENGSGVVLRGVSDDIRGFYQVLFNLLKFASEGFVVVGIVVYLFITDFVLAVGILIVGLLSMILIIFGVKKKLTKLSDVSRKAAAELGKYISQINAGVKDIFVYNRRGMFVEKYDEAYARSNVAEIKSGFASLLPERIIEASCISGIIISVLIRIHIGIDVNEFVPKLSVFAMGAFRLLPSIAHITGYISTLIFYRAMFEATYDNIVAARNYKNEHRDEICEELNNSPLSFISDIAIKDIGWEYPSGRSKILDGVNLVVKKGEAIGIIGESGSGKSTLADLILGLYTPQNGNILMDDIPIKSIPDAWARIVAYVPQMVFIMDDTIRENILFGSKVDNEDDIWEALRKASLDEYVRSLPMGLDTMVGERGVKFSGGQRQRIAIARALYNKPQIMLLDEATSALDNDTEKAVMEAIDSLAGSVTLIIIAHRLSTLKNCDKIYEIVGGKAVEREKV